VKPPFLVVEFSQPYNPTPPFIQLPLLSPLKRLGEGDAIHTFAVTYRTYGAGKLGWFLAVHGLMTASSTPICHMAVVHIWQL